MTKFMTENIILHADNLTKIYHEGGQDLLILDGLNFQAHERESIAIVGASGAGKSTLLHLLGGLDAPTSGSVMLCGKPFSSAKSHVRTSMRNQHLGFIYQFHHLLPEFTALENAIMPLLIRNTARKQAEEKGKTLLDKVGLGGRFDHKPSQLSGGERQRVAIVRAMISEPACILADEPTGNLDESTASATLELLFALQSTVKTALIVVTHDQAIAQRMQSAYRLADKTLHPIAP